ncbi:hypothetical protein Agabi119p4_11323 [Agaricus bisporus var. burnettii]|uniref:Tetrapyrrole biosynthesis uroporphyrinogen III synthase domain-containing protein n=1 Tax=Agaricus bisporus var. burnettii TaxID=192524 RepID=A0A8H7BYH8_AGABI|nr:hypothetical protein Agabi119p4_11323 [Agaricus bisporus var. burnettii]
MSNILLLRSPSETAPDPYERMLEHASYSAHSISVLETSFTDLQNLQNLIAAGPDFKDYVGVIITSKRSCEALTTATKILSDKGSHSGPSLIAWTKVPFYVVGKGTASALGEFQAMCGGNSLDLRGEIAGTGEQLAHFILGDLKTGHPRERRRMLYLTGDKNRDTIPNILSSEEEKRLGIELDPIQVYETRGSSTFGSELGSLLQQTKSDDWWIIFFAPSSTAFTYPFLQQHFRFTNCTSTPTEQVTSSASDAHKPLARVGAIGRVTSTYLEEELMLRIDAVASKPTPEELLAAISGRTTGQDL